MPRNIEIKAKVEDLEALTSKARNLAADQGVIIEQEDTFFHVPNGRLKLRDIKHKESLLIQYSRPDQEGPTLSDFHTVNIGDPKALKTCLSNALGVKGAVHKSRLLIMLGQTRIHLDQVRDLGQFMELEVELREDQTENEGQVIAEDIMQKLGISKESLIDCAYMDMILKNSSS